MKFLTEIFRTQILSLIVIIEFKKKRKKKKEKRKKKKEKKSYTSCVSLSAHIVGLKHYQYYYLLTQDVRLGIYCFSKKKKKTWHLSCAPFKLL